MLAGVRDKQWDLSQNKSGRDIRRWQRRVVKVDSDIPRDPRPTLRHPTTSVSEYTGCGLCIENSWIISSKIYIIRDVRFIFVKCCGVFKIPGSNFSQSNKKRGRNEKNSFRKITIVVSCFEKLKYNFCSPSNICASVLNCGLNRW